MREHAVVRHVRKWSRDSWYYHHMPAWSWIPPCKPRCRSRHLAACPLPPCHQPHHTRMHIHRPLHLTPPPPTHPLQVLVRLSFGIDMSRNVAMKLAVRSESPDVSEAIHQIIQEA